MGTRTNYYKTVLQEVSSMTADQMCRHLLSLFQVPISIYAPGGTLVKTYPEQDAQLPVCDYALSQKLLRESRRANPLLVYENASVVYGLVRSQELCYVIGPCAIAETASASVRIPLSDFTELVIMLYETVTGDTVGEQQLWFSSFGADDLAFDAGQKIHRVYFDLHEENAAHNSYAQEQREQECIRKGDLEQLQQEFRQVDLSRLGRLSTDPLRHGRNMAIVLVTLACRSAIAGGVSPELAFKRWTGMTPKQFRMSRQSPHTR